MPLFSTQQKISFLSRPGPPKVISFKNWAVFKHQWPLKIKGQHVNSPHPRSQISPLLEMKDIFEKTSCAWSCLHFCPMGLFGQGCQRLSEHREQKTKTCCPGALWGCQGFARALVHSQALDVMWGTPRDAKVSRWFVIPTWLKHWCSKGSSWWHCRGPAPRGACGQLQQDQLQQGGGTGRKGCGLCAAIPTLSPWGCPREVAPSTAPPSCPVPHKPQPQTRAKPSRWRGIKMCCAYNADLSVCSRKRNEYSEVAGKGVDPATMHIRLCTVFMNGLTPGKLVVKQLWCLIMGAKWRICRLVHEIYHVKHRYSCL